MTGNAALESSICYQGSAGSAVWEGRTVVDPIRFGDYLREVVRPRVRDDESSFEPELHGLATTGMATEFVERLLKAVPDIEGWEIGEALAECALKQDCGREVHWPWNSVRDRRAPRASLPGADLVGFYCDGEEIKLLFGEVKTSSDVTTPPGVMYGGSGMTWQLQKIATRLDVQRTLLQWLYARCHSQPHRDFYTKAVSRYLSSGGKDFLLVGVLVRDTPPNELDLKSRATALSNRLEPLTRAEIIAWYLPVPIAEWPSLVQEDGA